MTNTHSLPPAAASGSVALGDLTVNRIGYGAMRITGEGTFGPPADPDECIRTLRRTVELGVNFIDTADSYGPDVSEELIAKALHPYPDGLVIGTKGGFTRPGPDDWRLDCNPARLREQLEGSLRKLKVERIDLWQLHRIDDKYPAEDQFALLAEFISEGKVRHVGLSEVGVKDIKAARKIVPIVSVQNRYNIADREWEDVVDYCQEEKIAFIPWYPLGAGLRVKNAAAQEKKIESVATKLGATKMQLALAWLLRRSPVILPIPGTSKVAHLKENVAAAAVELSQQDLEELS
ncbi:MAG: aldo/keto reductase [Gemmatimonadaceae bacterium]|nr:aldo/keto reductase [Gemmatimonadaceae bacterium]